MYSCNAGFDFDGAKLMKWRFAHSPTIMARVASLFISFSSGIVLSASIIALITCAPGRLDAHFVGMAMEA